MSSDDMHVAAGDGEQLSIEGVDSVHGGMAIAQARQALGISIDELSSKLKVSPRKLEHIERGEFDKLSGGDAYVRGLVRAVCKAVGIEPESVLAQIPTPHDHDPLKEIDARFAAPFAASGRMGALSAGGKSLSQAGRRVSLNPKPLVSNSWIAGAMLLALAALVMYAWPAIEPTIKPYAERVMLSLSNMTAKSSSNTPSSSNTKDSKPATPATATTSTEMPPNVTTSVTIAPGDGNAPAVAASAAVGETAASFTPAASASSVSAIASDKLVIQATSPSWVEIRGATGTLLVSRSLAAGEKLEQGLERRRSIVIGNASGTQVWVRGKAYDVLAQASGNNVARFDVE